MDQFFPPLIGGAIIGLSASLLLLFKGKIFGITGIIGGILGGINKDSLWRVAIILGLVLGSFLVNLIAPNYFEYKIDMSYAQMIIAGLLVGFGTRLGSGCTSGHGVCGLPRFSPRSFVATMVFMLTGIITVYIIH